MANDKKKQVEQITDMEVDFAQWYTDVCKKAELIDYSSIKGMFIYRPYGYAIWENIQREMDRRFKETGHENVYLPMLIPESLLQKEKDHVEGFAPECAWVTYGGSEKLEERYCIRPTSETLFCEHYKNIIHSHRDLPKLYNQWCSVLRWEKTSRPFLRHREFLWQEGHTMHATPEEAREETMRMLNVYADFMENVLAMPVAPQTPGLKPQAKAKDPRQLQGSPGPQQKQQCSGQLHCGNDLDQPIPVSPVPPPQREHPGREQHGEQDQKQQQNVSHRLPPLPVPRNRVP